MANQHVAGFAKVQAGWTGTITITVGSDNVQIDPSSMGNGRESAASVVLQAVQQAEEELSGTWNAYATTSGAITIDSTVGFDLVCTSNTATRTGLSTYSSQYSVTGSAHPDGTYPLSLGFNGSDQRRSSGRVASDGSGALPLIWESTAHSATITDTWANVRSFEETLYPVGTLYTVDLWAAGQAFGRYTITGAKNSKGVQNMAYWSLALDLKGVE